MFQPKALTWPAGFRAAGARGGLKTEGPDVALIVADAPCVAAAVFTTNLVVAAPVLVSKEHLAGGRIRAVFVNSGCANAVTGEQGMADARFMAELAAATLGCAAREVLIASTGVIGHRLPMEKLQAGLIGALGALAAEDDRNAALAIMTTDLVPKTATADVTLSTGIARIGGICKGSGMIAPNMATMLGFLTTDAAIAPDALQAALAAAVEKTFNCVTVDGDASTNDTVILLSSGAAGNPEIRQGTADYGAFLAALTGVCDSLARQIARDGEGATKLVVLDVAGARHDADAMLAARAIAESPLVKTALFGNDPNWGRILAAAGRSGASFVPANAQLSIGNIPLLWDGEPLPFDAEAARAALQRDEVDIRLDLGSGPGQARMYTCDFSYDYVRINAEYHT